MSVQSKLRPADVSDNIFPPGRYKYCAESGITQFK